MAADSPDVVLLPYGTVINNQALNGTPDTGYIETNGKWSGLRLDISATRDAYTDVSFTCVHSPDKSTDYKVTEVAAGGAVSEFNPTYTSSVSVNFVLVLNVSGLDHVKCTFAGSSAGASDFVTVKAYLTRGL